MGREDLTYFTSLLWATGWSGESECCEHTYVLVCSSVVMENWTVNQCVFVVKTYFESKSIVQLQRRFWREFAVPRHGITASRKTVLKWVDDFGVCDSG
jgi:hypothetical protein